MLEFINASAFFSLCLTLAAFGIGTLLQKKLRWAALNPILIGAVIVLGVLKLLDIPNEVYQAGCRILTLLITPATICLAISCYTQFQALKKHLPAILVGVTAGTVCSLGSVYLLCLVLDLNRAITMSLLPKSVTTAIGVALSQELGGLAAVTTAVIIITGILGNILGPGLCKLLRITDPAAQGVAFGTASHVVGTAKAAQISELTGAVSSFSLTFAGFITALFLSFLAQFL